MSTKLYGNWIWGLNPFVFDFCQKKHQTVYQQIYDWMRLSVCCWYLLCRKSQHIWLMRPKAHANWMQLAFLCKLANRNTLWITFVIVPSQAFFHLIHYCKLHRPLVASHFQEYNMMHMCMYARCIFYRSINIYQSGSYKHDYAWSSGPSGLLLQIIGNTKLKYHHWLMQ